MNGEIKKYNRHSIRLKEYDYSEEGAYFVTIVTHNREMLFGKVVDGKMVLSAYGEIVKEEWLITTTIRKEIKIEPDEYVIMPDHVHGIVVIENVPEIQFRKGDQPVAPTTTPRGPTPKSIGSFIGGFKSISSKRINELRGTPGIPVWQRGYYDHIIRNEKDYNNIANYIAMNPLNWMNDDEFID